jgi:uncharacterized protein (TIRG00374 family)
MEGSAQASGGDSPEGSDTSGSCGFHAEQRLSSRIGEVVRAVLLSRRTGVSFSSGFATVVVARLLDGLTLSLMTLLVMASMWADLAASIRSGLILAGAGYLVVLLVLVSLRRYHKKTASALVRPLRAFGLRRPADRARSLLLSFAAGLDVMKSPRTP